MSNTDSHNCYIFARLVSLYENQMSTCNADLVLKNLYLEHAKSEVRDPDLAYNI